MASSKQVTNRYAGKCCDCGEFVDAGEGYATLEVTTDKWLTHHVTCSPMQRSGTPNAPQARSAATPEQLDEASARVVDLMIARFGELLPDMVGDNMAKLSRTVEIQIPKVPKVKLSAAHYMLDTVLQDVMCGGQPMLVGPTGSGKTTLAQQIAKALKRPFFMSARITGEYGIRGFIDAHGNCARTPFREAYEHGGVFLFDEVDASDADALTSFNAGLSNDVMDFPDGRVARHKDFVALAAANTFGRGADRQYVGRNQLDAATLDRFDVYEVDYDEAFELMITPDQEWTRYVQKVRAAVAKSGVRHIVSPRASLRGGLKLAGGMDRDVVEEATIWKGLDTTNRQRVEAAMRSMDGSDIKTGAGQTKLKTKDGPLSKFLGGRYEKD